MDFYKFNTNNWFKLTNGVNMIEYYKDQFVSEVFLEEYKTRYFNRQKERREATKAQESNYNMRKWIWFGFSFCLGFMYDIKSD